jgi:ribosomal protein L7/L12
VQAWLEPLVDLAGRVALWLFDEDRLKVWLEPASAVLILVFGWHTLKGLHVSVARLQLILGIIKDATSLTRKGVGEALRGRSPSVDSDEQAAGLLASVNQLLSQMDDGSGTVPRVKVEANYNLTKRRQASADATSPPPPRLAKARRDVSGDTADQPGAPVPERARVPGDPRTHVVVLRDPGVLELRVLAALEDGLGIEMKSAQALVKNTPCAVARLPRAEAEALRQALEDAGAVAQVRPVA